MNILLEEFDELKHLVEDVEEAFKPTLTKTEYRRILIERVNKAIQAANVRKVKTQKHVTLPMSRLVSRRSLNRAVSIARRPGPYMNFKKGDLDDLLIGAGFRP